jgi:hypothetical protein
MYHKIYRAIKKRRTIVLIVPPAHHGNFGDSMCLASALELTAGTDQMVIDLFNNLHNEMKDWTDFTDINAISIEDLRSLRTNGKQICVIYLAQDSLDSRFDDYHLLQLQKALEILREKSKKVRFAIWNLTASEEYEFSETAMTLLKFATCVVPRDEVSRKMLAKYGANPINEIFDLSSVFLYGVQSHVLSDPFHFNSSRVSVNFGHQIVPFKETLIQLYSKGILVAPDTVLILDSREYPDVLSDKMMAIDLFRDSGVKYEINEAENLNEFFLDLNQKIKGINGSILVQTSRYHVAIAALFFQINCVLITYNNKFDVIHNFAKSKKVFENEKISIYDLADDALDEIKIRDSVVRWKNIAEHFLYQVVKNIAKDS